MQPFQFDDPLHERVHEKLQFIGDGPAAFFRDICRMLNGEHNLKSETHLISHLLREIESAVRDAARTQDDKASGSNSHRRDIKNILEKLDIPPNHPVSDTWLKLADQGFEFQFNKLAHRDSFNPPRRRHEQIEEVWESFLYVLDEVIDKIQGRYFSAIEIIDNILDEQPSTANAKTLANNIPHNETTLLYLFDQCDNPEWLPLLNKQGFFDHPPAIIYTDENTYRYPRWPAAIYLEKVADKKPKEVSKIIKNLPTTDNRRVYEDLVKTIQQMPAEVSAEHTNRVLRWIKSGSLRHAAEPYFDLAFHLAENGYQDNATRILRTVLGPVDTDDIEKGLSTYSPDTRISDWEFKKFLNEKVEKLRDPLQLDLLKLVCGLLNDFLEVGCTKPNDFSYSWKRDLNLEPEESENFVRDPKEDLLNLLILEINIQEGSNLEEIVNCLNKYDWHIFNRVKLLLHERHSDLEEVKKVLLDPDLFDKYWISQEYRSTLNQFYPNLDEEEKIRLLGWIKEGLSSDEIKNRLKGWNDNPTEEEISAFNRKWQLRKLHPIYEYLEGYWDTRYQELVKEFGEPTDEKPLKGTTFVGPTSPKTADELISLPVEKVIAYLKSWKPGEAYDSPSHEGLGRVMAAVVKKNPLTYSQQALAFTDLRPTYVRSLISGLRDAVNEGTEIHWEPVLELSTYAVKQTDDEPSEDPQFDNPEWEWTRKRIANLLGEGCKTKLAPIPFKHRKQVWKLLEVLVEDPQPDLDHEKKYHGGDPMGLSINTVRGEAMHALFYYTRWVRKELEQSNDTTVSFEQIPEVRQVLEQHLDTIHDPTLTIRSVYGQHLGTLVETEPEWLNEHLRDIFPEDTEQASYFKAAWNGFIKRYNTHELFLENMRSVYIQAIRQLNLNVETSGPTMADRRLIEHLLSYYWWQYIELDDELIATFFEHVSSELKGHMLESIGRSLDRMEGSADPKILNRLKDYIHYRIEKAQSQPEDKSYRTELAHFGWCFTAGCFEDDWVIARLHDVVQVTPHIEHDRSVMQKLTNYIDDYPEIVIDCIERMVKNVDKTMRLHVWKTPLKELLAKLLKEDDSIAKRAKELVQYISQKSYHLMQEFKPLLD